MQDCGPRIYPSLLGVCKGKECRDGNRERGGGEAEAEGSKLGQVRTSLSLPNPHEGIHRDT
jgi:hypothetical protein